jgi:hypothetical protein
MRCRGSVVRSDRRGKWLVALLVAAMASGTAMATGEETRPKEGSLFNVLGSVVRAAVGQSDSAAAVAEAEIAAAEMTATHAQVAIIRFNPPGARSVKLHTFCLDHDGNILAGCSTPQGEIRTLDPAGKLLKTWPVDIQPEAIGVAPDGAVYVAGNGKLLRLDQDGKVVLSEDSPHAAALRANPEALREQIVRQAKQMAEMYDRQIEMIENRMARINDKKEKDRTAQDEKQLANYTRMLKVYRDAKERQGAQAEPSEAEIAKRVQSLIDRKTRVSSISATADAVYIACQMSKGYGFEVWKMDRDFAAGESIVKSLRGCCGQMDVRARGTELFVAENSRHRVCRYDNSGKMIVSWGKSSRQGIEGFGSCCNPMNVCFGPDDRVYTAESTSGRIKCYRPDGTLVELVGKVKIVPGCKNVAIDATQDGSRVYMLDITRSHIVVMERTETAGEKTAAVTH